MLEAVVLKVASWPPKNSRAFEGPAGRDFAPVPSILGESSGVGFAGIRFPRKEESSYSISICRDVLSSVFGTRIDNTPLS